MKVSEDWQIFLQDWRQFAKRHPVGSTIAGFLHLLAVFALIDCLTSFHSEWPFQAHINDLVWRAGVMTLSFRVVIPWLRKSSSHPSQSDHPANKSWAALLGSWPSRMQPHNFQLMTDKQAVIDALDRLPEKASLEGITEELHIMAAIKRGRADIAAGRSKSHDEVELLASRANVR